MGFRPWVAKNAARSAGTRRSRECRSAAHRERRKRQLGARAEACTGWRSRSHEGKDEQRGLHRRTQRGADRDAEEEEP